MNVVVSYQKLLPVQDTHDLMEEQEKRLSQKILSNTEGNEKMNGDLQAPQVGSFAEHIEVDDVTKALALEGARLEEHAHATAEEIGERIDDLSADWRM